MVLLVAFSLVSFLVACLVIAVVVYVLKLLVDFFGVPQPIKTIILLIVALVAILYLVNRFLGVSL